MSDHFMKFARGQNHLFHIFITLLLIVSVQVTIYADQPSSTIQGGRPAGSYDLSEFDNINLFNGNLNFRLPLLTIGGRGEANFTISVVSETRWKQSGGFVGQAPVYSYDSEIIGGVAAGFGELEDATTTYDYNDYSSQGENNPCQQDPYQPTWALITFNFKTGDGTTYPFRPTVNSGRPIQIQPCPVFQTGTYVGKEFITWDGSGMKLVADYDVYHNGLAYTMRTSASGSPMPAGWTVLFPNGTRYRIEPGFTSRWLEDRNGNRITFVTANIGGEIVPTQIKDSLGRIVTIDYLQNEAAYGVHTKITYKGFNGDQKVIRVGELLKIWLPDGRTYNLTRNANKEITRVELPTGGAYEYEWGGTIPPPTEPGQVPNDIPYRYVTERRVYADGVNLSSRMTFTREFNYPNTMTRVDTYDGSNPPNLLSRSKHYFHGDPRPLLPSVNPSWANAAKDEQTTSNKGKEYLTESYAGDGSTLLRKNETGWQAGRSLTWSRPFETRQIEINHRVEFNKVTLTDVSPNLVSQTSYLYNQGDWVNAFFNVRTDSLQYDYGQGTPGAFLNRVHSDYISYDYGSYLTSPYIPLLLSETWTSSDSDGDNKVSRVKYEYDSYSVASPLVNCPNITGHNPNFGTSYTQRGNVTKITSYANAQNQTGAVSVSSEYDIAGNVVKKIDAREYATTFDYTDRFGSPNGNAQLNSVPTELSSVNPHQHSYAFPTLVTNALGLTAYTQYDYYQGVAVDSEDANGVLTSAFYNDVLGRPTQVVRAIGTDVKSQTTFSYDDVNRKVTTTGDLNNYGDNLLKSETLYDKLGRTTESHSYEPGGTFITAATEYDALGRVKRASNPYRAGDDIEWTTSVYDALGRVVKLTTPDGAEVNSYFKGHEALVKDQAGKERMSRNNALGQLKDVWEITSPDGATEAITFPGRAEVVAGYRTKYGYDTLGNLTSVTQQQGLTGTTQTRLFAYNSLSRMTSSTNPESGTISYDYDPNGNLETRTDPRALPNHPAIHITTGYTYDELNRVKTRTYNDGTPNVTYSYDDPNVAFSKGQLNKVSSSVSETKYGEFDALGRVRQSQQLTDGQAYPQMSYTYDLAGNLKTETYPSGRVVTHSYDGVGRLSGVTGQKTGESNKTYASDLSYKAHGAIGALKLGNNLWEHTVFNARLQATEIGLGTTSINSSVLALNYSYGTTNNNGNVQSQTITATNLTLTQTYEYDDLNRLKMAQENDGTNWKQTFTYDRFGNRRIDATQTTLGLTTENPVLNPADNRILPQTGEFYDYDLAGNLTKDKVGNTYAYDADGRQVRYNGGASVNGGATYSYDGEGKRVMKVAGVVATVFVYDALGQLVAEYSSAAAEANGTQYVTADTLGSPRLITGADGSVRGRHDYRPFGEEIGTGEGGRSSVPGYAPTDDLKQKFTGYERDIETGLDYAQARYFSSPQGRFTSPDPLLASGRDIRPQTWNRYTYALNNPLRFTDPSGLSPTANITPRYQSDDLVEQQRQQQQRMPPPSPPLPSNPAGLIGPPSPLTVPDDPNNPDPIPQPIGPLSPRGISSVRASMLEALNSNPECSAFMTEFLTELGTITGTPPFSTDPVEIFEKVVQLNGMKETLETGVIERATGSAGAGNAKIWFHRKNATAAPIGGAGVLHGVTHVARGSGRGIVYSHSEMDRAAFNILGRQGLLTGQTGLYPGPIFREQHNYAGTRMDAICRIRP